MHGYKYLHISQGNASHQPTDASGNAYVPWGNTYCQQIHIGTYITNRCMWERITLANRCVWERILPTDVCGNTYCQHMHAGTHTANRCVWECFSWTDACGNASHQQTDVCRNAYCQHMRAGTHLTMRTTQNYKFGGTHLLNQYLVFLHKDVLIPLV